MILDLFAGPGGWSVGLNMLGLHDIGMEWNKEACRTRIAAGHSTLRADVSNYPTEPFVGKVAGLIASPPCQDFSVAGKRAGINGYRGRHVFEVLRWTEALRPSWVACEQVPPVLGVWEDFARIMRDQWGYFVWTGILNSADFGVPQTRKRAILMASTSRFASPEPTHTQRPTDDIFGSGLRPWVTMAEALGWGITDEPAGTVVSRTHVDGSATGGVRPLDGGSGARAKYGRAQSEGRWALHTNRDQRPDGSRQVVTADRPAPTVTTTTGEQWRWKDESDGHEPGALSYDVAGDSGIELPASGGPGHVQGESDSPLEPDGDLMLKGGMWSNYNRLYDPKVEPSPTVAFGHDAAGWAWVRPATTVVSSFRPDIIAAPGYRVSDEDGSRQDAPGSIQVTVPEVAVIQSFPADYPFQGSNTKEYEQVGNAIPPLLAKAIIAALI